VTLYTIGFTKKTARRFFESLKRAGVKRLVDIRLNNVSQLAAFAKKDDLEYFADVICGISYHHFPELAPTQDMLDALKKHKGAWSDYEVNFQKLMEERHAIAKLDRSFFEEPCCLLCSEATPQRCHRRLVADAMKKRWADVEIIHL
jgi:uncharacterized protein (DUF488 family)